MKLLDRSPGYFLGFQDKFIKWPDLKKNPYLKNYSDVDNFNTNELRKHLYDCDIEKVIEQIKILQSSLNLYNIHSKSFFERFILEFQRECETLNNKDDKNTYTYNNISFSMKLAEEGYFIDNIPNRDINSIKELLKYDIIKLINKEPIRNYREYDRSIFYKTGIVTDKINEIYNKIGYINAAQNYFGFEMNVFSVTLHISFPDDIHKNQVLSDKNYSPKTCGLHFDPKSGTIKSILYLKTVGSEDGPFKYLPRTHNLINPPLERLSAKANSTTNYLDSDTSRKAFMNLPTPMRKTSILGTITDDSDVLSKELLQQEKELLSEEGNCIVFDPAILHRGGDCKSGYRISLQIALRKI